MAMSPDQPVDFSNGKVLHVTMEVDLHQDLRRWMEIELSPANDPLTHFESFTGNLNNSDQALFLRFTPASCALDLYTGPNTTGSGDFTDGISLWGGIGAVHVCAPGDIYWGADGVNLDNRGKVDLFVSQNEAALFINGKPEMESEIPGGLPFTQARVYFTHYVYHTGNDIHELQQSSPWETYWINYYHWSDERHWDNMGFEVLPSSSTDADWQSLVAMPQAVAPTPASSAPHNNATTGNTAMADMPKSPFS
jgi:hypothetical protein